MLQCDGPKKGRNESMAYRKAMDENTTFIDENR